MTLAEPSIGLSDSSWLLTSTSIRHTGNEGTAECATEVGKPFIHNSNPQRIIWIMPLLRKKRRSFESYPPFAKRLCVDCQIKRTFAGIAKDTRPAPRRV